MNNALPPAERMPNGGSRYAPSFLWAIFFNTVILKKQVTLVVGAAASREIK